jgi:GT2 family glycosyltransferase
VINDDVVCDPCFVERICAPLVRRGVAMAAGVLTQRDCDGRIDSAGIELDETLRAWDYLWNRPVDVLEQGVDAPLGPCGGAAAYRTDVFRGAGGFDGRLFAYWEDAELAIRLRQSGWRCELAAGARAQHYRGATLGAVSTRQRQLDAYGRAYVLAKHGRPRRRPGMMLKVAALDWPHLVRQGLARRTLAQVLARRRGAAAGRTAAPGPEAPRHLATVGFLEAVRRQVALYRLERSGRLPAWYGDAGHGREAALLDHPA